MEEPPPPLPVGDRDYRACRRCRLVLSGPQFLREGCPACRTAPPRREELNDATTADFTNFIGLIAPEKSWVARLIGRTNCPNGVFAAAIDDEEDEEEEDNDNDNDDDEDDEDDDNDDGGEEEEDDNEMGERDETNEQQQQQHGGGGEEEKMHRPPVMTDEELLAVKND